MLIQRMKKLNNISSLNGLVSLILVMAMSCIGAYVLAIGKVQAQTLTDTSTCPGQVALWHMNETTGSTMHDATIYKNNGTLHNVTLGESGINSSKAYGFNGSNSYVSVPNNNPNY